VLLRFPFRDSRVPQRVPSIPRGGFEGFAVLTRRGLIISVQAYTYVPNLGGESVTKVRMAANTCSRMKPPWPYCVYRVARQVITMAVTWKLPRCIAAVPEIGDSLIF
jgi:hypothetical protein